MHHLQRENQHAVEFARELWQSLDLAIPVDYLYVANAHDVEVIYRKQAPQGFLGILRYDDDCPRIVLNAEKPARQLRYAAIHEIGHFFLDAGKLIGRPHRHERVCQVFAANVAMPPDLVRAAAGQFYGRYDMLQHLAVGFGVTTTAMQIQLRRLRIFPGEQIEGETPEEQLANRMELEAIMRSDLREEDEERPEWKYVPLYHVNVDAIYKKMSQ